MDGVRLKPFDVVIFCLTILISLGIGVFHAFRGQRQRTTNEFLMANRRMGFVPVSMSLLVTIMSAITILGVPSMIYQFGTGYCGFTLAYFVFIPVLAHFIMPVLYDLRLTSAYEFLEMRFSPTLKLCGTVSYILMMTVYMGVVLYAPALAYSVVTGVNAWASVITLCVVCCVYTCIGGMKAVIWTDVFQASVMFLSQVLVLFLGAGKLGGFGNVFEIAANNSKITPMSFDPSPLTTHSFWAVTIGGTFLCLNIYGTNQSAVQRFLCCKSKKEAKIMIYLNLPFLILVMFLGCSIGLVIFAQFKCDNPLSGGVKADQLLLHYVVIVMRDFTGLAGLFTGCLFAASLSTISSCFNSLATVTLQDFVKPRFRAMTDERATVVAKFLVCVYALLCLFVTVLVSQVDSILKAALSILGIMGGPLLSMFLIGMSCRHVNSKGMLAGFLVSMATTFFIGYGALAYRMTLPPGPSPPVQLSQDCPMLNSTISSGPPKNHYTGFYSLFRVSYMWYSFISCLVSFVVSSVVSFACKSDEIVDDSCLIYCMRKKLRPSDSVKLSKSNCESATKENLIL